MSRRKQAKPRSLKADLELNDSSTIELKATTKTAASSKLRFDGPDSVHFSHSKKQGQALCKNEKDEDDGQNYFASTPDDVPCDTNDSLESALGNERASSWRSETPDDVQTSPTPSSCRTPSSTSDLTESDLTFTVGATETTPYVCQFCEKAFPRLSFLKKHEQSHGDLLPFRCNYCSRLFKHKRSRDRHIKLHTGDKKYRCNHCEAAFSRSDHLKIHLKTHDNQKPFQCTICNRGYNTAAALTSHMLNHKKKIGRDQCATNSITSSPDTFRCSQCEEIFSTADHLQKHTTAKHSKSEMATPPSSLGPDQININAMPIPANFACMYCAIDNFTTMEHLKIHVQSWHSTIASRESSETPQSSSQESLAAASTRTASPDYYNKTNRLLCFCNQCTMSFSTPANLKAHQLIVHHNYDSNSGGSVKSASEVLPLVCIECSMNFTSTALFSEHILNVHVASTTQSPLPQQTKPTDLSKKRRRAKDNESKRSKVDDKYFIQTNFATNQFDRPSTYICNQCNAALPDFESFRQHLKTHLECNSARTVPQADDMLVDMIVHDPPLMPVFCIQCCALVSQNQFNKHYNSHFISTSIEYGCQSCKQTFPKPDELQKHLLDMHSHHMFRCTLCKDVFESKVEIQVHFAVHHSNECNTYRCAACPNSTITFHSLQDFDIHVQMYHSQFFKNNVQTISCPNCPLTFHSVQGMQTHALTHQQCYQCFICLKRFSIEFLLDRHMQQCHSPLQTSGIENNSFETSTKTSKNNIPSKNSPLPYNKTISPSKHKQMNNNNVDANKIFDSTNCDICNRNDFANEVELVNHKKLVHHMKIKASSVSLHCAYCNENCKSRTELENHMKTHSQTNGGTSKHKCNICDELCPSAEILAQHKLTHCKVVSGSGCTQCKTVLTSEEMFYNHMLQHSNNGSTGAGKSTQILLPTPCVICRQTLIAEIEVQYHAKFHLKASSEFQCVLCCKVYDKKNGFLTQAFGQMPSYACKDCYGHYHSPGQIANSNGVNYAASTSDCATNNKNAKRYSCTKCPESFDTENAVQSHVALHVITEGCNYECHLCRQILGSPLQLQAHLIEHTFAGCGSYTCYLCSSVFTTAQGLQNHIADHGLEARPYDCRQCALKFFFRAELDNHANAHLYEINFKEVKAEYGMLYVLHENNAPNVQEKNIDIQQSPICICSNCNFPFSNNAAYEQHIEQCCMTSLAQDEEVNVEIESVDIAIKIESVDIAIKIENE